MTYSESDIVALTGKIDGWLDPQETRLLYRTALAIPENGVIVEIGSYRGKSTVIMGYAALERNATVYAVDPFEGVMDGEVVSKIDRDHLRLNLKKHGVTKVVQIVTACSASAAAEWGDKTEPDAIDFIFIDGSHMYEDVLLDLQAWSPFVVGKIACHDHNENWPGVMLAVDEFTAAGEWRIVEQQDATVILERVN